MQCLGVPSCRRRSVNRSQELYLQEQSRRVAALNGQRLGKGCWGHRELTVGNGTAAGIGRSSPEPWIRLFSSTGLCERGARTGVTLSRATRSSCSLLVTD